MNKLIAIPLLAVILLLIDIYAFQAVRTVFGSSSILIRRIVFGTYWTVTIVSLALVFIYNFAIPEYVGREWRSFIMVALFINYFSKTFGVLILIIDDIYRLGQWVYLKLIPMVQSKPASPDAITRTEFLSKTALITASIPMITMGAGILTGAHDYRIRRRTVSLPNLPRQFDGIKIAQLSDIHSGSFFDKKAVQGGVDMLLNEKPDLIFFTGDLVNNESSELNEYFDVFSRVKAPLGVYSTLGNHDYGDYHRWNSAKEKQKNLQDLIDGHKGMGWDIMLNENRTLKVDGESIGIIGMENWGAGRFSKYGDLYKAYQGIEDQPVKLLLSHDPSHWDAQVRPEFPDIDLMFAGHTHGFQFGVEIGNFKWSPSQYVYKQWCDLYQEGNQYLYVNRGFGYLGYPGRIGILPEITILELKKA